MGIELNKCRICGNSELVSILNLGSQFLTGIFPKSKEDQIPSEPVELVKCQDEHNASACGLVQMKYSFDHNEMFGDNYGYRSGLNASMVCHLQNIVSKIAKIVKFVPGDLVVDIGSNDSTLLQAYKQEGLLLAGIDPTAEKFKEYYSQNINLIPDFFSAKAIRKRFCGKKAKVVTSIAMFYDLESPLEFAKEICEILDDNGVWFFEQSYMPTMLKMNSYDTICHEHLEYYGLKQIKWILDKCDLKIIDIDFNDVNGGSFAVAVARSGSFYLQDEENVNRVLSEERALGLHKLKPYEAFKERIFAHRDQIRRFFEKSRSENKKIFGYGASTKGNVLLQFCDITTDDIPFIAEVNSDKFGHCTPGTNIPIISESDARKMNPDYFLVLPWHFRAGIIKKEKDFLGMGGKLVFPLPVLDIVSK